MILFYDTETSGFLNKSWPLHDPRQNRIVQLGAILDYPDGREAMRLDVIVAHKDIPQHVADSWPGAEKFHLISRETSEKIGINETTVMEMFLDMIEVADTIVGQNIKGFDNDMVTAVARRVIANEAFTPFAGKNIFDTMFAGQPLCRIPNPRGGGLKKPNLTELHKHLFNGEGFDKAHSAINDVLATRRCFYKMQELLNAQAPQ